MPSNSISPTHPSTRREFLRHSGGAIGLLAFSQFAPQFLVQSTLAAAPAPEKDRSILVLVQLAGGNDGLNTVVPFADPDYYRLRPTLGIPRGKALPLGDTAGLHPVCGPLRALFDDGKVAVVQNVGYPNPNRSHFRSTEIWETASSSGAYLSTGWVGRFLDNSCAGIPADSRDPAAVHISNEVPQSFAGSGSHPTFGLVLGNRGRRESEESRRLLAGMVSPAAAASPDPLGPAAGNATFLRHTLMDALVTENKVQRLIGAYRPGTNYPGTPFASSLRSVAALIAAGLPTRIYFVSLGGFDTHSNQVNQHANLLTQLSTGLAAFQRDLEHHGLDGQVTTMTFSEFGRRPAENSSRGTDHGTAAPLFVMGSRVRGGFHGAPPSLQNLARGQDIAFSTDFRQVYATVLEHWLDCPSQEVLGGRFEPLPFLG